MSPPPRRRSRAGTRATPGFGALHDTENADLETAPDDLQLPLPEAWQRMPDGRPTPNVVRAIRESREEVTQALDRAIEDLGDAAALDPFVREAAKRLLDVTEE